MKFKEKASALALAVVLSASSLVPVNAYTKEEIVGNNRYETAAKIADQMGDYSTAILVNGNSIADGLSASALAGKENAPILLVKKDSIPQETMDRLTGVEKVYIIGKENAISSAVEYELLTNGKYIQRIGGDNRIETSLEVSEKLGNYSSAFLVNGFKGEADAMSVASIAARDHSPIILTNGEDSPTYRKDKVRYYAVGGGAVMSNFLEEDFNADRLSGLNRYETNKVIVERFYPIKDKIYFAKGDSLVDALTVSPLAKDNGLVLVSENSDKSVFYQRENIVQVGGMSNSIVDKIINSINENLGNQESEKNYEINSPEFQKIFRDEFYRLLDEHRAENGRSPIKHHWACEESALMKSQDMIENDYYDHDDSLDFPHLISAAENIAWINTNNAILNEEEGKWIAEKLFQAWKYSEGHNKILLKNPSDSDIYNGDFIVDGVAFYGKWDPYAESYTLKATYHSSNSGHLMYTDDTTNDFYKPEISE